jgi:hypothetical protein
MRTRIKINLLSSRHLQGKLPVLNGYDRNFILRVAARIVLSVVLGCAATEGLYLIDKFGPYSSIRDRITDVLTFPGLIIARLFQFVGIHTGGASADLWWAFFLGNSFFYAVLCYFILDVLHLPPEFREF